MTNIETNSLLEANGWNVECESPFEIRHNESGSFATGLAAKIVVADLEQEAREDKRTTHSHQDWQEAVITFHKEEKPFSPENGTALKFKIGDSVIFTNEYGASFEQKVTGFYKPEPINSMYATGHRYLLDWDCPWMPCKENELSPNKEGVASQSPTAVDGLNPKLPCLSSDQEMTAAKVHEIFKGWLVTKTKCFGFQLDVRFTPQELEAMIFWYQNPDLFPDDDSDEE